MTAKLWDADAEVTSEDVARLIERSFPELRPVRMELLGTGWDNIAFRVNQEFVFRFPRRKIAVDLIEIEKRVLPLLAPFLPQPIPAPVFVGVPDDLYPYPFVGYPYLSGVTACRVEWSEEARAENAVPLARFLAHLHSLPVDNAASINAPGDTIHRADLSKRLPVLKERVGALHTSSLPEGGVEPLLALAERLASTPQSDAPPCWVHGDLYARHLLMDDQHRLCGVIDWGDVHLGDRALDISIAFSFLPPGARELFRNAYSPIDAATWDRARFRALHYGAVLVSYGSDVGDKALQAAGEYALQSASETE